MTDVGSVSAFRDHISETAILDVFRAPGREVCGRYAGRQGHTYAVVVKTQMTRVVAEGELYPR